MIIPYRGRWPEIHETAFVAPSCDLIGDITIGEQSSVWFQCVLRGDVGEIRIGKRTSVQDHTMIHSTRGVSTVQIGSDVTIGHRVTLHGCKINDRVLVGMGAIILDNAEIGSDSIIGAGTLVTKDTKIPPGSLALGSPAKVVRKLTDEEIALIAKSAANYVAYSAEYQRDLRGPARVTDHRSDIDAASPDEFDNDFDAAYDKGDKER